MKLSDTILHMVDYWGYKVMLLPVVLTEKSTNRAVRLLGFFLAFPWLIVFLPSTPVLLLGVIAYEVAEVWEGPRR